MVINLGKDNSIFNNFIAELRDSQIQQDSMRFRRNLERVGEIMGYEISKTLNFDEIEVTTTLGLSKIKVLKEYPVLIPILRAGVPLHKGMLNIFDRSASGFISAYRKVGKNEKFTIKIEYVSSPNLDDKIVVICDPMLATGASIVEAYKALKSFGKPAKIHIASVIASVEGLNYIKKQLPMQNITIWTGAIDDELTAKAYIVPGLGDAGDLAYGDKSDF
ncbi:MAG TPA: uracil phosphoribosyltransferase [Bacteroidales bacterium]|nr:uracil phosphoribosyltransferase [Bacteroidales bacterium]HPE54951.1 uracil phosphoribosyltransferase [Bacteroidales bacterium]HRX98010.1 uracil phosphoribosyltransferase [Bacteroidales bacterium]